MRENHRKVKPEVWKSYLESRADGAVDEEVNGRVDHHQHPGEWVHLVEVHGGDVLTSRLDASDNQTGGWESRI